MFSFILGLVTLVNSSVEFRKVHDKDVFYNFVFYQNELFVGSNKGIYKLADDFGELNLYDASVKGLISPNLTIDNSLVIKFIESPIQLPREYSNSVTDFVYHGDYILIIARGRLLVFKKSDYTFSPYESVRSISDNGVGTYGGVYLNDTKLKKIAYTDGQIREFGHVTMVCYNGLLKYEGGEETIIYLNDNSKRTEGKYGLISDVFYIDTSRYLLISNKGIYEYNMNGVFELLYSCQKEIVPIRVKDYQKILQSGEFDFIDDGQYISLNVIDKNYQVVDKALDKGIIDALECSENGNYFYMISEGDILIKYVRTIDGLELVDQKALKAPAHTIIDFNDLVFVSGNNGLSIYSKSKNSLAQDVIVDEFNKGAIFKSEREVKIGSIHGVYIFDNLKLLEKKLLYSEVESNPNTLLVLIIIGFTVFGVLMFRMNRRWKNKLISDDLLISLIKRFIRNNLSVVTLDLIEDEFKLDYNELNDLSNDFNPARYIRKQRGIVAKEMFLANQSISAISQKSGYSESYLVKNKKRFLKL